MGSARIANLPPQQPSSNLRICVIGAGYVGLTVAAGLAHLGHTVACTDANPSRVQLLRSGDVPILEHGLPELIRRMHTAGRLSFSTDNVAAARDAEYVFVCVPTPQGADGAADVQHVRNVADELGPWLRPGAIVINKSTVPIGTAELVVRTLARDDVTVVSNPEFLAEGSALADFLAPDRIVIGSADPGAAARVAGLYGSLASEVILTDLRSAEMIKYAANAYLAMRVSYVNSMAELCEATGADIRAVTAGMGSDRRIGRAFLRPGPGWGGSCFPKDTRALIHIAAECGVDLPVVGAAVKANGQRLESIVQRVVRCVPPAGATVALWGLTYKRGTDDLRDSPSVAIADRLTRMGIRVQAYDPTVRRALEGIDVCDSALAACRGADALIVGTEWPEFIEVDLGLAREWLAGDVIIDTRNLLDADDVRTAGLRYSGVGIAEELPALPEFVSAP